VIRSADLIFCHKLFRFHNDWVCRTAGRLGIPYCVVPHGGLDPYVFTYRRLRKAMWMWSLGRKFFAGAAGFLFATRREKEKAAVRLARQQSWVINWPVPRPEPSAGSVSREDTRARLGATPSERILLFLGRLDSMKRPLETISAFGLAKVTGTHLVIAGPDDGYSKTDLEDFARRNGVDNVHVLGPLYGPAKWEVYRAADAFINLSARENFGFTVAEALAAGLPVLLSPGNDLIGDIRDTQCGWFLEDDGETSAAEAIRSFAATPSEALRQMGARGEGWAQRNTSIKRFQSSLLDLCREVTGHD
jgi:glycosyltransferase involved in cell wall biosynthesis